MDATQVLVRRCDLPSLRFDKTIHGSYSVSQKQQQQQQQPYYIPMSRREGSGLSHTPQNAPEGNGRDSRPPSLPASRYVDLPMHPSTQHGRSDPPQYSPYGHPPPHTRLSYPPDPPPPDSRHSVPPPRQMEMTRPHERAVVYARPPEYYTTDTLVAPVHQPAPRQRTAVACRYCRRRKVCFYIVISN